MGAAVSPRNDRRPAALQTPGGRLVEFAQLNAPSSSFPLCVNNIEKRYGRTEALAGVSLAIPFGSVTALVGPNGAGKSTLLKTWVGFERPTRGTAAVHGLDPWTERAKVLPHVGYVPQTPALYRSLSVADHLTIAGHYRRSFDRQLAVRRLGDLGISERARAGELSGGQAAQLGLAIALGTRADVLLLDEPLASLDPLARREFLDVLIDDVRSIGRTVVLSSHVVTDIAYGCDRIVILAIGRKMLDESIADTLATHWLLEEPGTSPHESVVGRVRSGEGRQMYLTRQEPKGNEGCRPATLDDVVMAYLATGRSGNAQSGES